MQSFKKIMKLFIPQASNVLVFYVLSFPALFVWATFAASWLPDFLYYTPLSFYIEFFEITPALAVLFILALPAWNIYGLAVEKIKPLWRNLIDLLVLVILCLLTFVSLMQSLGSSSRFNVGHPYCKSPFIADVSRCEGRNFGFMQSRLSGVALLGPRIENFEQALLSSEYHLKETPCFSLAGQFGDKCYTGSLPRRTGDENFLNIYTQGTLVLVLLTENVPMPHAVAMPHKWGLDKFLNIERFEQSMR